MFWNTKIKVHYDPIDMYFEFEKKMHIFEVKSWIPSNLTGQFRKGIAQLLDYEYQFKFEDEKTLGINKNIANGFAIPPVKYNNAPS